MTMKNLRPKGVRQQKRNSRKADFNKATGLIREDSSEKLFVGKNIKKNWWVFKEPVLKGTSLGFHIPVQN